MQNFTSAAEYLRALEIRARAELPDTVYDPELREQRLSLYRDDPEAVEFINTHNDADSRNRLMLEMLVAPFLSHLPNDIGDHLRTVPIGFLPSTDLNAFAIRAPDGNPIVIVNTKTGNTFNYFCQLIQAAHVLSASGKSEESNALFLETIDVIRHSVVTSAEGSFPPLPGLTRVHLHRAGLLVHAGMTFIIAHEFAHIVLDHLSDFTERSLVGMPTQTSAQVYNRSQLQEFEADACAFEWMLGLADCDDSFPLAPLMRESPAACLEILALLAYIERKTRAHLSQKSTHPRARDRIRFLKEMFGHRLPTEEQALLENWSTVL